MKKVLVFGGSGLVGSKFIDLNKNSFDIKAPLVNEVDILKKDQLINLTQEFNPDTLINFAAYTQVEKAEKQEGDQEGICYLINAVGAKNVAEVSKQFNKKLIHISTEYVFDGTKSNSPYTEKDQQNPINWYGTTKYFAEQFVLENGGSSLIVRICMPFSSFYELKKDVARFFLEQLRMGNEIIAIDDQKITPTLVDDIASALKIFVESPSFGIYHVCSKSSTTPFEFAKLLAKFFNLDTSLIKPISFDKYNQKKQAKLLKNSWLDSTKFRQEYGENYLHTIEENIQVFKKAVDQVA